MHFHLSGGIASPPVFRTRVRSGNYYFFRFASGGYARAT